MAYIVYFNIVKAKTIVNSPYNERQNAFADRIVRGSITDRNGNVLAETEVAEDGTEIRTCLLYTSDVYKRQELAYAHLGIPL